MALAQSVCAARARLERLLRPTLIAGLLALGIPAAAAEPLPQPEGAVILTVSGRLSIANNDAGTARFDREMLADLGVRTLRTTTPWTEGIQEFEGVLVRDVLARVGGDGVTVEARALNDYIMAIPVSDFRDYDVILAMQQNGKPLRVRDKGPLWIVYPYDSHAELRTDAVNSRWVWQLLEIKVE